MALKADIAIVGTGAMGALTAWRLARRGARVVAIEGFHPGHPWGSSHGDTRMIRTATRGPDYVPWVKHSFELWRELEADSGEALLTKTGALLIGRRDGDLVQAAIAKSEAHGLAYRLLSRSEVRREFPAHRLEEDEVAVLEEHGGLLRPETAVRAAVACAEKSGATVAPDEEVLALAAEGSGLTIRTARRTLHAGRVIVAAGARTKKLLPDLPLALAVERQVLAWLAVEEPRSFTADRFPVFTHELPGRRYLYGFPSTDGRSIKVAAHHGGPSADPDTIDRQVHAADLEPIIGFAAAHLRGAGAVVDSTVCMYTNAPRGLFYVTSPPGLPGVIVVNACNGDGFKFAAVIGDVIADHVLEGRPLPALLETAAPAQSPIGG